MGAFAKGDAAAGKAAGLGDLLFADDFTKPLDASVWVAEIEPKSGAVSTVYTRGGALVLDTRGGVTVWLNKILKGDLQIEFDRKVLVDTGRNDRLSDMNVFWMAMDPANANLFTRHGRFGSYDSLQLYYVGMGGNTNKTTRFRKYYEGGNKPVVKEYLDRGHLLEANKTYHVRIVVDGGVTSYWVDGDCYFSYADPAPLTEGYFGFRSTWSRQEIQHFKVWD
jgi:rhamnogalacturonan endolyase